MQQDPDGIRTEADLDLLRWTAIAAQKWTTDDGDAEDWRVAATTWVKLLVDDESSKSFFYLQDFRSRDDKFYVQDNSQPTLKPKRREGRPEAWPEAWWKTESGKDPPLAWLEHPERLTVTELELAFTIFDWEKPKATFVGWILAYPHILRRIHAFLLKRYCFELLTHFRRAQERGSGILRNRIPSPAGRGQGEGVPCPADAFSANQEHVAQKQKNDNDVRRLGTPPFRAGEWWHIYPRVAALAAVGILALIGIDMAMHFFFHSSPLGVAVMTLLLFGLLYTIVTIDVFKQNHGVIGSRRHGSSRIWRLWFLFLNRGLLVSSFAYCMMWYFVAQAPMSPANFIKFVRGAWNERATTDLTIPAFDFFSTSGCLRDLLGILALGAGAAVIGALLQWIWDDRSAAEPI